jgi:hypothetical protein
MKFRNLFLLLSFLSFCSLRCHKDQIDNNSGLPPATQEGKNTLGFLLNGQPWTPQGFNGTANLSIDYDPGFNSGVLGISAYRIISSSNREYFSLGIKDSLNYYSAPFSFQLTNSGLYRIYFSNNTCTFFSTDSNTVVNGKLSVSKLDKTNHIISGTFDAKLYKPGCDTIKITDGRFDLKY